MKAITASQRRVLERGYMVLYLGNKTGQAFGDTYWTWAALIDRGWLRHERSNLREPYPWERYRVTRKGKAALADLPATVEE
jgi:hypothetical protein